MKLRDILLSVRFGLGDAEAAVYSDSEIIESANSVMRYANTALVNLGSSIAKKKTTLTPVDGEVALPDDFIAMDNLIYDEDSYEAPTYLILGNVMYTKLPITFSYFYNFIPITDIDLKLPLPEFFYEMIVRFTEAFTTKSVGKDVLSQVIYKEIANATIGREYATIERPMPFTIR